MAIKIKGTTIVDDDYTLQNVVGLKTIGGQSILGSGDLAVSGGFNYSSKTADFTASNNDYIFADTSAAGFTITLPATPDVGDIVVVCDLSGNFGTNQVTVIRNGSTIEGSAANATLAISSFEYSFVYIGGTWRIFTKAVVPAITSPVYLKGPTTANEGTTATLVINNFNHLSQYNITVTGGTTQRWGEVIEWTLPSVNADTVHEITVSEPGVGSYTHKIHVINLTTTADMSISVTVFGLNTYNDGWTV